MQRLTLHLAFQIILQKTSLGELFGEIPNIYYKQLCSIIFKYSGN